MSEIIFRNTQRNGKKKVQLSLASLKLGLHRNGIDLIDEWSRVYDQLESPEAKLKALENMMRYVYPQLKAEEIPTEQIIEAEHNELLEGAKNVTPSKMSSEDLINMVMMKKDQ